MGLAPRVTRAWWSGFSCLVLVLGQGCAQGRDLSLLEGERDADASVGSGTSGASGGHGAAGRGPSAIEPDASSGAGSGAAAGAPAGFAGNPSTPPEPLPDPTSFPTLQAEAVGSPELIADTFMLAESPLWDHCAGRLLFTDVSTQTIRELDGDGQLGVFHSGTLDANGMAWDADGSLLLAEMGALTTGGGRVSRLDRTGTVEVIVDQDPAGQALGTVDDLVRRSDGTLYFTDPLFPHGSVLAFGFGNRPVYRLTPGRELVAETQVASPNGIELSPDEHTLYVVSYSGGQVLRYQVGDDGSLTADGSVATGLSTPDSMCVDAAGNLYVGVSTGLQVLRPDGTEVTLIPIASGSGTTNCTFGGDDGKTLYITAWTTLWKVGGMPIPGLDWLKSKDLPCGG